LYLSVRFGVNILQRLPDSNCGKTQVSLEMLIQETFQMGGRTAVFQDYDITELLDRFLVACPTVSGKRPQHIAVPQHIEGSFLRVDIFRAD
jgi:hypothetical protein